MSEQQVKDLMHIVGQQEHELDDLRDHLADAVEQVLAAEARVKVLEEALRVMVQAEWMVTADWAPYETRIAVLEKASAALGEGKG